MVAEVADCSTCGRVLCEESPLLAKGLAQAGATALPTDGLIRGGSPCDCQFVELFQSWQLLDSPKYEFCKLITIAIIALGIGLLPYVDNWSQREVTSVWRTAVCLARSPFRAPWPKP